MASNSVGSLCLSLSQANVPLQSFHSHISNIMELCRINQQFENREKCKELGYGILTTITKQEHSVQVGFQVNTHLTNLSIEDNILFMYRVILWKRYELPTYCEHV